MDYIAYLHKEPTSDYGVSFPDFPGCVTAGKTLEEARSMAVGALSLHVQGLLEDGEQIPPPSTLDSLANDRAMRGAVAVLVPLQNAERTVRVNITARKSQLEKIDQLAKTAGLTRSANIVYAATRDSARAGKSAPSPRRTRRQKRGA